MTAAPKNFDDTTPLENRPIPAELGPETIVNPRIFDQPDDRSWRSFGSKVFDVMWDVDDVLCPTIESIHQLAFEAGLHDGTIEPAWDGAGQYGCEPQIYWDLWSQFAASGGYVNTPPIPDAAEAVRRLYWAGHRIHLVTARGFMAHAQEIRAWTPEWLESFALPWHTLTYAQDKVAAQIDVAAAIFGPFTCTDPRKPIFDYAIDDRARTIDALRGVGVEAYLLNHAHNRDEPSDHRVESASKFVDIILEAAQ